MVMDFPELNTKSLVLLGVLAMGLIAAAAATGIIGPLAVSGPSFTFTAAGDSDVGGTDIPWIQANGGDFFFAIGDLGYTSDEVSWCNYINQIGRPVLWVVGNHDTNEDGPGDFFAHQAACPIPSGFNIVGTWGERYYFDYPTASPTTRFIVHAAGIGGSQVDGNYDLGTANYNWVASTIDQAQSLNYWTIVVFHKPCISVGQKSCETGTDIWNLMLQKKVDLVLNGHDHNYQRTHQLTCGPTSTFQASCVVDSDGSHTAGQGLVNVIDGNLGTCCYGTSGSDSEAGYFAVWNSGGNIISKFSVTSTGITETASGVNGHSFSDAFSISTGGPPPPGQLVADFTINPAAPSPGESVTFTASASGGTSPYAYSWDLAGTSATGQTASKTFTISGTYTIVLTVTDSASQTATKTKTLTVSSSPGPRPTPPLLVGWGGVSLNEASKPASVSSSSAVFSGEQTTTMEAIVAKMRGLGYNALRTSFESVCASPAEQGPYSSTDLERAFRIAEHFNIWLIVDYHGYNDLVTDGSANCWLSYWQPIVSAFKDRYAKTVWEPLNEPTGIGDDVTRLSTQYQRWIDQARGLGDTNWVLVQNICSFSCGLGNFADGFPTVTDPQGKVLISLHSYMGYLYVSPWTTAQAEIEANRFYNAVIEGITRTGWGAVNTELSADELCDFCAPDEILTGSAGYTTVSLHFANALVGLYDTHLPRVGWVGWPAGSWTNTPGAGDFGALAPDGWGLQIQWVPVDPISQLSVVFDWAPKPAMAGQEVVFTATPGGGVTPYSYTWDFGDSGTALSTPVSHTYAAGGSYTVKVTLRDAIGIQAVAQQTVQVQEPSAGTLIASFTWTPAYPQPTQTVVFTSVVSGIPGPYSLTWNFGDGTTSGPSSEVGATHAYTVEKNYQVILTVTASGQTATAENTVSVSSGGGGGGGGGVTVNIPGVITGAGQSLQSLLVTARQILATPFGLFAVMAAVSSSGFLVWRRFRD